MNGVGDLSGSMTGMDVTERSLLDALPVGAGFMGRFASNTITQRHDGIVQRYLVAEDEGEDLSRQVRQQAYEKAVEFCKNEFKHDRKSYDMWLSKSASMADVVNVLNEAKTKYELKQACRTKGVVKMTGWWSAACSGIRHYASVVDVLVSSNPEYAALAWGAMRFLVLATLNHEELSTKIAQSFIEIGDLLSEMDMITKVYPMKQIKFALAKLYAHIILFLMRATKWYYRRRFTKRLVAIAKPWAVEFQDILSHIGYYSATIRRYANAASFSELRELHIALSGREQPHVQQAFGADATTLRLNPTPNLMIAFNYTRIRELLSLDVFDPGEILQLSTVMRDRRRAKGIGPSPTVWLSNELKEWISTPAPSVLVLKGSIIRGEDSRDFALDLIHMARSVQMPTIWILGKSRTNVSFISAVDIIRSLIQQILEHYVELFETSEFNEKSFRACNTTRDWVNLFVAVVDHIPRCLVVIEAQDRAPELLQLLEQFWAEVVKRRLETALKILLLTYRGTKEAIAFPTTPKGHGVFQLSLNNNRRPGTARSYSTPKRGSLRTSQNAGPQSLKSFMVKLLNVGPEKHRVIAKDGDSP